MNNSTRVVFNTSILYVKLIVGVVIGLITIRIVLDALGETDYGIYTLVAGVVGLLGVLNGSMSRASMRFMSYSLGSGDREKTLKTFNTTLLLHFLIGSVIVLIIEAGGFFLFKHFLNIPTDKIFDAKIVFHLMVATTFVSIISVPYDAVINSHEDILALSLVDILGHFFKLGIAIYLTYSSLNLLILYGFLLFISQVIQRIIKQIYSKTKYDECKIRFREYSDLVIAKEILSFTGWNLFGSIASISMTQIRGILLNYFFGVGINAAEGISKKVAGQVNMVSTSMTRALNPQLVKSAGGKKKEKMLFLTNVATKYSLFLFSLLSIPVFFELEFLLNIWLKEVPEYSIVFCQLILIGIYIEKFSFEITSTVKAVGDIRLMTVLSSIILLLNIPISFLFFFIGYPPQTIFFVSIILSVILFLFRLWIGKKIAKIKISDYLKNAILPLLVPNLYLISSTILINFLIESSWLRVFMVFLNSLLAFPVLFLLFSTNQFEKNKLKKILEIFITKIRL